MSEEQDKAKAKIAKLLNMTVENGCSEDEQETAMRLAAGAAARAGIDLETLRAEQAKKSGHAAPPRKAVQKSNHEQWKIHQVLAARAAGVLYAVDVTAYTDGSLSFVGREENIELTEQTMFWLMRQVELLYKQYLPKGMTQRDRAEYRKTFKAACANRVYQRAQELMAQMKRDDTAAQAATGQNALVVAGYFTQLEDEKKRYYGIDPESQAAAAEKRLARRNAMTQAERDAEDRATAEWLKKASKRKGPRARYLPTGNGTNAGRMAGDNVKLRKEVE